MIEELPSPSFKPDVAGSDEGLPLVSICMPVLNARPFLDERLDSLFAQTYTHWELIVIDGYSDDGSWEELLSRCAGDDRIRLYQVERKGVYPAINHAISEAHGAFIYIATADDTMQPTCLATLVKLALSGDSPCVAQCGLALIDTQSTPLPSDEQWPFNTEWEMVLGDAFKRSHVRLAPLDGAMVLIFGTMITSFTQALFPREAFSRIGPIPDTFGSAGDMAWEGLLGFLYDIRYTPECLATWRFHTAQATRRAPANGDWLERRVKIGEWILDQIRAHSLPLYQRAHRARLSDYSRFWRVRSSLRNSSLRARLQAIHRMIKESPFFYARYLIGRSLYILRLVKTDPVTNVRLRSLERFMKKPVSDLISSSIFYVPL